MIQLIVDGVAVPKQRPRLSGRVAYTPKKTRDYEERVRQAFRSSYHDAVPVYQSDVPVKAYIEVIIPIPKSWSNKKHIAAEKGEIVPTARNGDVDNYGKSILDALNGLAYEDDAQVTTLYVTKKYGSDPYVLVKIEEEF